MRFNADFGCDEPKRAKTLEWSFLNKAELSAHIMYPLPSYWMFPLVSPTVRPRFTQPAKMRNRVIARPEGSSLRLKCMASGNPRPDIVWLKDDRPLTEQEVGEGRQKKWTLSLRNLTPEQSGRYTCRVSNRAGEINATYKVDVVREYPTERLSCTHTGHTHLEIRMLTNEASI